MDTDTSVSPAPLVSVIVPTYRRITYLTGALHSALDQTFPDIEIIVSDDAASPEVEQMVARLADRRLRYRHNGPGVGATRNALAAYVSARGQFLATLHDDDEWEPTFLEQLLPPLLAQPELTLAFSDHWVMGPDGRVDQQATDANTRRWKRDALRQGIHRPFHHQALVHRSVPTVMATVFRRSAIDWNDFPREMEPAYDLWLAYLASRDGAGAYYLPQRLTRYRVHPSAESALRRHDRALVYCYDRFLADERLRPIHHELRRVRARFHTGVGIMLLSEGERLGARNWFRKALGSAPDLRAVLGVGLSLAPGSPARFLAWFRRARSWLRRLRRHPTTG